jgi:methyltransferase (TIGR00027 family)
LTCKDRPIDPERTSLTALGAALMRAVHTRLDRPVLIDDPWGERLITTDEREILRGTADDLDAALRSHPSYGTVILRARYAEDVLAEAVARGVRQYVIVGAGMDSFALRRPAFAAELEIFEIDHPATQQFKMRRLASCGIELPPGLRFVPADLTEIPLDAALTGSSFRADRQAVFAWLGVTSYLTRSANLGTLRAIASCAAPGSELVFTYLDQRIFEIDPEISAMQKARAALASAGEPWVSGFHPDRLGDDLRTTGFELVANLGPEELHARYCADRADGLAPSPSAYVARGRITT